MARLGRNGKSSISKRKAEERIPLAQIPFILAVFHLHEWTLDAGMYEPLYLSFDTYPSVVPRVRVRGVMALFLAATILWALVW